MHRFTFSWIRSLGITSTKQEIQIEMDIPATQNGLDPKFGSAIIKAISGKK